jgi:hypothetical protein
MWLISLSLSQCIVTKTLEEKLKVNSHSSKEDWELRFKFHPEALLHFAQV